MKLLAFLLSLVPPSIVGVGDPAIVPVYAGARVVAIIRAPAPPTCEVPHVLAFTGKDGGIVTACHVGKMVESEPGACGKGMVSGSERRSVEKVWSREVYRTCTLKDWIRMHATEFWGFTRL